MPGRAEPCESSRSASGTNASISITPEEMNPATQGRPAHITSVPPRVSARNPAPNAIERRVCTRRKAAFRIAGGRTEPEPAMEWSGHYCGRSILHVVGITVSLASIRAIGLETVAGAFDVVLDVLAVPCLWRIRTAAGSIGDCPRRMITSPVSPSNDMPFQRLGDFYRVCRLGLFHRFRQHLQRLVLGGPVIVVFHILVLVAVAR